MRYSRRRLLEAFLAVAVVAMLAWVGRVYVAEPPPVTVTVVGQVKSPGMKVLPAGASLGDAIEAAGGYVAQVTDEHGRLYVVNRHSLIRLTRHTGKENSRSFKPGRAILINCRLEEAEKFPVKPNDIISLQNWSL